MNISDNNQINDLLKLQLMTMMFKQSCGDSNTFQLVLESLSKASSSANKNVINLEDLPLDKLDIDSLSFNSFNLNSSSLNNIPKENVDKLKFIFEDFKNHIKSGTKDLLSIVEKSAQKYGIDKELILSVIQQESSFNPKCTSHAGAMGLMQLMPENCTDMAIKNPYDIEENIDGGTRHLKEMLDLYGNNKKLALAAYNAGRGTLKRRGVNNENDIYKLPNETRNYVKKVMGYYGKAQNTNRV